MRGDQVNSFLNRWSLRKQKASDIDGLMEDPIATKVSSTKESISDLDKTNDADSEALLMPTEADLAAITGSSCVSQFMQHGVDKQLKKAALRKMFLTSDFAMEDEANYSTACTLESKVAKKLRDWIIEPITIVETPQEQSLLVKESAQSIEATAIEYAESTETQALSTAESWVAETKTQV